MTLEDKPRAGRPSSVDNAVLKELIESDPSQTIRELALILNVQPKTIANHLHEIGKVWKHDQWVPHKLSETNKSQRLTICNSLLQRNNNDPFWKEISPVMRSGLFTTILIDLDSGWMWMSNLAKWASQTFIQRSQW